MCITVRPICFSYFVTWILGSLFRPESWWRVVCLVSFLHPEWGRLFHATANVFLPRTKQKLLLPERASRGLWESQSLGGNKVCVLHMRTHFKSLLSYHVFEDCSLRWLRWCNFKLHISHLNGATFLSNCICQVSGRVEYMYYIHYTISTWWISCCFSKKWHWAVISITGGSHCGNNLQSSHLSSVFFYSHTLWSSSFVSVFKSCRTLCLIQWVTFVLCAISKPKFYLLKFGFE